ncbi:Clp protease N-terminal domain-containing protein [Streptomyces xantholiticus]|uniref:Clp protease N-terminal domain-containing protein n=1 Tax=Streptomyces xantholiticus TaxID=68285 RepID=UPI00167AB7CD|nr:Clp protease N-terminal domain-containing protein [Streptomyces xantholiticus]
MFERFTDDARAVVIGATACAERADASTVTNEHLLLALMEVEGARTAFALRALGITDRRASLEAALADARRRGGMTKADEQALAGLGIDVGAIVARVEETHGAGALAGDRKDRRWWSGHRSFTREAKQTLEKSLRIALGRRDRSIGAEHILLALTAVPGVVSEALADHGATYATLERAMFGGEADGGTAKAG